MGLPVVTISNMAFSGTFLGVTADVYTTVEGAAQALEEAQILGPDVFGLEKGIYSATGIRIEAGLNEYQQASKNNCWALAGESQRQLASLVRGIDQEDWKHVLFGMPKWAFGGGIFATSPKPKDVPQPTVVPGSIQGSGSRNWGGDVYADSLGWRC